MRINNNPTATSAYNALNVANSSLGKHIERLSSGFRINRASDDAAGLVISEKLRSQINGSKVAIRNALDGISMLQVADGALAETTSILQRMRDLAMHYNNGATDADSKDADMAEWNQLIADLDRIDLSTKFGETQIFAGALGTPEFVVGASADDTVGEIITFDWANALMGSSTITAGAYDSASLGLAADTIDLTVIAQLDDALTGVTMSRGFLGAMQNRFDHVITNLTSYVENMSAAESRIRDTDMAAEMTQFSKSQILQQTATAMLAQANAQPQAVLSLLRG